MGSANFDMCEYPFVRLIDCGEESTHSEADYRTHGTFIFAQDDKGICSESADAEISQHSAYCRLHLSIDFTRGFIYGSEYQILQHFDIAGFYGFRVDVQAE